MRTIAYSIFAAAIAALSGNALALPVQGELGQTSSGSFDVAVTVDRVQDARVRVSGLSDVDYGTIGQFFVSSTRVTAACFYHTSPTFALTVSGAGGQTPIVFADGLGNESAPIAFNFILNTQTGTGFSTQGGTRTGLVANTSSETCASGGSSIIELSLAGAGNLPDGAYSTRVNLVMAVE